MSDEPDDFLEWQLVKELLGEPSDFDGMYMTYGVPCCKDHNSDVVIVHDPEPRGWLIEWGCRPVYSRRGSFVQLIKRLTDNRWRRHRGFPRYLKKAKKTP